MGQSYQDKGDSYFSNARKDISPLLPKSAARVLEIGCGAGATLAWLKRAKLCQFACGVELFESSARIAEQHAEIVVGDAELLIDSMLPGMEFDLILCLDVLEHMVDPWAFVEKLPRLLAPGGEVIFSIPNVRNLRVVLPLVLLGRWRYEEAGVLDRTHLRFFGRHSALELATTPILQIVRWRRTMPPRWSKLGILHLLTLGLLRDFMTLQYLIVSKRRADVGLTPPHSATATATATAR